MITWAFFWIHFMGIAKAKTDGGLSLKVKAGNAFELVLSGNNLLDGNGLQVNIFHIAGDTADDKCAGSNSILYDAAVQEYTTLWTGITAALTKSGAANPNTLLDEWRGYTEVDQSADLWLSKPLRILKEGVYRVCGCYTTCTAFADMDDAAGYITVEGPDNSDNLGAYDIQSDGNIFVSSLVQANNIIKAGVLFDIKVIGNSLSSADRIHVQRVGDTTATVDDDFCSTLANIDNFAGELWKGTTGISTADSPSTVTADTTATYNEVLVTRPGEYVVCWCGDHNRGDPTSDGANCAVKEEFAVLAAKFTIRGPKELTVKPEIAGKKAETSITYGGTNELDVAEDRFKIVSAAAENFFDTTDEWNREGDIKCGRQWRKIILKAKCSEYNEVALTGGDEVDKALVGGCYQHCASDDTCEYFHYNGVTQKCYKFADLALCVQGADDDYNIYHVPKLGYTEIHDEKKCANYNELGQALHTTDTMELCQVECLNLVHCAWFSYKAGTPAASDNCNLYQRSTATETLTCPGVAAPGWKSYSLDLQSGSYEFSAGLSYTLAGTNKKHVYPWGEGTSAVAVLTYPNQLVIRAGKYRLCWCSQGDLCDTGTAEERAKMYTTQVGPDFDVIGAKYLDFEYTSNKAGAKVMGRTMTEDNVETNFLVQGRFIADNFNAADKIIIVREWKNEFCGGTYSGTMHDKLVDENHYEIDFPPPTNVANGPYSAPAPNAVEVSWRPPMFHRAGTYRICWCHGETNNNDGTGACAAAEDFWVQIGTVEIYGPHAEKAIDNTNPNTDLYFLKDVYAGQVFSTTIQGTGLEATHYIEIVPVAQKCTRPMSWFKAMGNDPTNADNTPTDGLHDTHVSVGDAIAGTLTDGNLVWNNMVLEENAEYNVCMCTKDCNDEINWGLLVGKIIVKGPLYGVNIAAFTAGLKTNIDLTGTGLTDTEYIRLVQQSNFECGGLQEFTPGMDEHCGQNSANKLSESTSTASKEACYHLCIADPLCTKYTFKLADTTCRLYSLCTDAESEADYVNYRLDQTVNDDAVDTLKGSSIVDAEGTAVPRVSASSTAEQSTWEDVLFNKKVDTITVCWCSTDDSLHSVANTCTEATQFRTKAGIFVVNGPATITLSTDTVDVDPTGDQDTAAVIDVMVGHQFIITALGTGLTLSDEIDFVIDSETCGYETAADVHWIVASTPAPHTYPLASTAFDTDTATWAELLIVSKGTYKACWKPGQTGGDATGDHIVHLATITVNGPNTTPIMLDETVDIAFTLKIDGSGLTGARIRLVKFEDSVLCGTTSSKTMDYSVEGSSPDSVANPETDTQATWSGIEIRKNHVLKICYCNYEADAYECVEDYQFNVEVGKITVTPLAQSKQWRLLVNSNQLDITKWAWAVFEIELHTTEECDGAKEVVASSSSSNSEGGNAAVSDVNLGPPSYAFDDNEDTFFQTVCGRYTTNENVQAEVYNVCNSDGVTAPAMTSCTQLPDADNTCETIAYLQATFSAAQQIRCIKVKQVPTGGARRVDTLKVQWHHPTTILDAGHEWVDLTTQTKASADSGEWIMKFLQ